MPDLRNKTIFISGGSRGIGLAIAARAAKDGANIVIAAKTAEPHPKLPGTIYTAAADIEAAGGRALPVVCDIRDDDAVRNAVQAGVDKFGGIDICINNASAISLTPTLQTSMQRFDLMHQINTRGTFLVSQTCIPHLLKSANPHILNLSAPLNMEEKWFRNHVAYSIAKYGMSMCVLGMAGEFREQGIAVNALWPRTAIATAAVQNLLGGEEMSQRSRTPAIMADAAHIILTKPSRDFTGNFCIDDEVLESAGITDLSRYAVNPDKELLPDFFVDPR
jgi:citronellol/citronellal dehydrogenase